MTLQIPHEQLIALQQQNMALQLQQQNVRHIHDQWYSDIFASWTHSDLSYECTLACVFSVPLSPGSIVLLTGGFNFTRTENVGACIAVTVGRLSGFKELKLGLGRGRLFGGW